MSEPIRIFVGCASGDDLESQAVLEYTLNKHASLPLKIVWMQLSKDPASPFYSKGAQGFQTKRWSTPFSGFRWLVPSLCGYSGRAIYMDSDMIAMADIAQLWGEKFEPGKCIIAKGGGSWRFCVSLWDCEEAAEYMPTVEALHRPDAHQMMIQQFRNSKAVQAFSTGNWNCIDGEDYRSLSDPEIKMLHYSDESAQPQLRYAVARLEREGKAHWFDGKRRMHWRPELMDLFEKLLNEARDAGYAPESYAPADPFGPYQIASHASYARHQWAR